MHTRNSIKFNNSNILYWLFPLLLAAAMVSWVPRADANIVIEGDSEFRSDVEECLGRYSDAEGLVSDAIRELENSANDHKITEGNDWENTPSDNDSAFNGTGTGTETRVSKDELERIKALVPELQNKDFCTALLHELWHAVDADRGQWSNDKQNNVFNDEIQATIFQNFMHAIRGVAPRASYGGNDISTFVGVSVTPTPTATPPPTPSSAPKDSGVGKETETKISMDYKHVAPGEYSEVYVAVTTKPGASVQVVLSGPGVSGAANQSKTANSSGIASFTWRIVSYGAYSVDGTANGSKLSSTINVR